MYLHMLSLSSYTHGIHGVKEGKGYVIAFYFTFYQDITMVRLMGESDGFMVSVRFQFGFFLTILSVGIHGIEPASYCS